MFNLNINKDDQDLTTSTKLMAADKISKFKRGKLGGLIQTGILLKIHRITVFMGLL